jgi:hypothetical protein
MYFIAIEILTAVLMKSALGCDTMQSGRSSPGFLGDVLLPLSGYQPSK